MLVAATAVFVAVMALWAPLGVILGAWAILAFCGGALLGRRGVLAAPLVLVVLAVRAEVVRPRPLASGRLLAGGVLVLVALVGIALAGCPVREGACG